MGFQMGNNPYENKPFNRTYRFCYQHDDHKVTTQLSADQTIEEIVECFAGFLKACGFHHEAVDSHLGREEFEIELDECHDSCHDSCRDSGPDTEQSESSDTDS